jgi:hypothetical protein
MAARLDPKHAQRTRDKIRVSQLLNLLDQDAFGLIKLEDGRRASIKLLLDKALPNLASQEITVTETQPFALLPSILEDVQTWQATFKPALPKPDTEH